MKSKPVLVTMSFGRVRPAAAAGGILLKGWFVGDAMFRDTGRHVGGAFFVVGVGRQNVIASFRGTGLGPLFMTKLTELA
jgi:hypothetical protein